MDRDLSGETAAPCGHALAWLGHLIPPERWRDVVVGARLQARSRWTRRCRPSSSATAPRPSARSRATSSPPRATTTRTGSRRRGRRWASTPSSGSLAWRSLACALRRSSRERTPRRRTRCSWRSGGRGRAAPPDVAPPRPPPSGGIRWRRQSPRPTTRGRGGRRPQAARRLRAPPLPAASPGRAAAGIRGPVATSTADTCRRGRRLAPARLPARLRAPSLPSLGVTSTRGPRRRLPLAQHSRDRD